MAGAAHVLLFPFALACTAAAAAAQPPAALTQQIAGLSSLASESRLAALTAIADAVTHLVAQFDDADHLVAREAVSALGSGGPAARAAAPQLQRLVEGPDKELAAIAARTLQQFEER